VSDSDDTLTVTLTETARRGGDLGEQAAVKFLTDSVDLVRADLPWVDAETGVIEWGEIDWEYHYLSGGQYAAWRLAYSMVRGEIGNYFWRLDRGTRLYLVNALGAGS
jgi:hypothetical protein